MRIGLLGAVRVETANGQIAPRCPRPRGVLARLALTPGEVVPRATLTEDVWGDDAPPSNALHTVVSRLRKSLLAGGADVADRLESQPAGYLLAVEPADVDGLRAEQLAATAGEHLATAPAEAGRLADTALALWHGEPLADVTDAPFAVPAAHRFAELQLSLTEHACAARLALGDHVALTELAATAKRHPLRERLQALLMRALYHAGRQADALDVYDRTRKTLADELGVDPSAELTETHLTVLRHEPVSPARSRATSHGLTPLPAQLTSFVGREDDLDRVLGAIDGARLVTIVGPGGGGKTRLANEVVRLRHDNGNIDACVVELAPVHDSSELPSALLAALGVRAQALFGGPRLDNEPTRAADAMELLTDSLTHRDLLLVLDSCEHLVDAVAELVDAVLGACPGLRVLVTTREPLGITGETLCPLPPLGVPPAEAAAADAVDYPAVRLFVDRARAVRPDFAVNESNAAAVGHIVRSLDGMPLAIELAAARVKTMAIEQVAARLDDRFRLLTRGSRVADARHQTLHAVVDWSWELLDEAARLLLARLSVFAGPATLTDIEQVCADDRLPRARVLDELTSLIDKSLVDAVGATELRYRLLETVRAYAANRLTETGESDRFSTRHAEHLLDVARRADPLLRSGEQLAWLARLDGVRDDISAALHWSTAAQEARLATGLVAATSWYWSLRSMLAELRYWPERVLSVPGPTDPGDRVVARIFATMVAIGETPRDGSPRDLAELAASTLDDINSYQEPSDFPFAALVEPIVAMLRYENQLSMELLDDVVDNHADRWTRATARLVRSRLAENLGDGPLTRADEDAVLDEFRRIGDRWGLGLAHTFLADRHARAGTYDEALAAYEEALDCMRVLGSSDDEIQTLLRVAEVHVFAGELDRARAVLDQVAAMRTTMGDLHWTFVQAGYGQLAIHEGRSADAVERYQEAVALLDSTVRTMSPQVRAAMMIELAHAYLAVAEPDNAAAQLRTAFDVLSDHFDRAMLGRALEGWAEWALVVDEPVTAAQLLGVSQALYGTVRSGFLGRHQLTGRVQAAIASPQAYTEAYQFGTSADPSDVTPWIPNP